METIEFSDFDAISEIRALICPVIDAGAEAHPELLGAIKPLVNDHDIAITPLTFDESSAKSSIGKDFATALKSSGISVFVAEGSSDAVAKALAPCNCIATSTILRKNDVSLAMLLGGSAQNAALAEQVSTSKTQGYVPFVVLKEDTSDEDVEKLCKAGANLIYCMNPKPALLEAKTSGAGDDALVIHGLGSCEKPKGASPCAFLSVTIRRDLEGNIHLSQEYIPADIPNHAKGQHELRVLSKRYSSAFSPTAHLSAINLVKDSLGSEVRPTSKRPVIRNRNEFIPHLTIREICEILGADTLFAEGVLPLDVRVPSIVARPTELTEGCVAVIQVGENGIRYGGGKLTPDQAREAKAMMAIAKERVQGIPTLVVPDTGLAWVALVKAIRAQHDVFTVAITGSIGKSTTTDLIKAVVSTSYRFPDVRGNFNTVPCIGFCLQKLTPADNAFVQEVHGGSKGAASLSSEILQPDMAVVTFVGESHLTQVGSSVEDVLREKLSIANGLKPGGKLLLNIDNEHLRKSADRPNVITYSAHREEADYHAENIKNYGSRIDFDIVCAEGRYPATLFVAGVHNVTNAICAFAIGRQAGIEPYKILAALSRFRTSGCRQNVFTKNGMQILVDCSSSTPDSMNAALETLGMIQPKDKGRRIAVLSNVAMLGKRSRVLHEGFAVKAQECGVDKVITYGTRAHNIFLKAQQIGLDAIHTESEEELVTLLKKELRQGDAVLYKGSPKGGADLTPVAKKLYGSKVKTK